MNYKHSFRQTTLSNMTDIKPHLILLIILCFFKSIALLGQNSNTLKIDKINGSYHKTIKLPVTLRILKQNEEVVLFHLDSIGNGYFYGNKGKDSILTSDIAIVNLRGLKEIVKYTSIAACAAITFGATYFTIYAFNYPVVICDGDGTCNNEIFKYIGMGYMATFGSLGTTLLLYPRTRFKTSKYTFQTN